MRLEIPLQLSAEERTVEERVELVTRYQTIVDEHLAQAAALDWHPAEATDFASALRNGRLRLITVRAKPQLWRVRRVYASVTLWVVRQPESAPGGENAEPSSSPVADPGASNGQIKD